MAQAAAGCGDGRLSVRPDRVIVSAAESGIFAASRVGSAVLTLRWGGYDGVDAETLAGWRADADAVLADLTPAMCLFAVPRCG